MTCHRCYGQHFLLTVAADEPQKQAPAALPSPRHCSRSRQSDAFLRCPHQPCHSCRDQAALQVPVGSTPALTTTTPGTTSAFSSPCASCLALAANNASDRLHACGYAPKGAWSVRGRRQLSVAVTIIPGGRCAPSLRGCGIYRAHAEVGSSLGLSCGTIPAMPRKARAHCSCLQVDVHWSLVRLDGCGRRSLLLR